MHVRPSSTRFRARLGVECFEDRLAPAIFTVTSTNDAGAGSLRQAIVRANENPGFDTIAFAINSGQQIIKALDPLPVITGPVAIAGQTQPGFNGHPLIELNGDAAGAGVSGLVFQPGASGSVVRSLNIQMFNGDAIRISASNCHIAGNYIGVLLDGSGEESNGGNGVLLFGAARGNVIGGTAPRDRNVISGNDENGILIWGSGANGNAVIGNLIGTDVTGTLRIANGVSGTPSTTDGAGVRIAQGASGNVVGGTTAGARNVISANTDVGVGIDDGSSGNVILGNFIGTDITGNANLGNSLEGVLIDSGASGNVVGGFGDGARNVISGNNTDGVLITGTHTSSNRVLGNFIGTDRAGSSPVANFGAGVQIAAGASGNVIGTTFPGAGNVISGNATAGVIIDGAGTTGNRLRGNRIGLTATSRTPLGNSGNGVSVDSGASGNIIGGRAAGTGNVIAFNDNFGVSVISGSNNGVLSNRIFENNALGIDLGGDGVTLNDPNDTDTGANDLINFPKLLTAQLIGGNLRITGALNTETGKTVRIEFFATSSADPSGFGQGQNYLGFIEVNTGGSNTISFTTVLPGSGIQSGFAITATATDNQNNSSEFSAALAVS